MDQGDKHLCVSLHLMQCGSPVPERHIPQCHTPIVPYPHYSYILLGVQADTEVLVPLVLSATLHSATPTVPHPVSYTGVQADTEVLVPLVLSATPHSATPTVPHPVSHTGVQADR